METHAHDRTASAGRWRVDGVDFHVTALWGLTIARGRFDRVDGSYDVGAQGTRIELSVDARSLVTTSGMWDNLLHSAEASGIGEHPEVRFTSTDVFDSGEGKLHLKGLLEVAGKVLQVDFDAVVHRVYGGLELEASPVIDEQHAGKAGGQFGMILPATVHVRAHLTAR